MLRDFFTINFPYGFWKIKGQWIPFNREYKLLSIADFSFSVDFKELPELSPVSS
jgi:hypothetical protein